MDVSSPLQLAIIAATLFAGFLPVIVALARSQIALILAAGLFSVVSFVFFGIASFAGIGAMLILPLSGGFWFAGLFCGLAAFLDGRARRRHDELVRRLLFNDTTGLPMPSHLRENGRREGRL